MLKMYRILAMNLENQMPFMDKICRTFFNFELII
jgi:hypothetical protein